jgi:hypothetical protein
MIIEVKESTENSLRYAFLIYDKNSYCLSAKFPYNEAPMNQKQTSFKMRDNARPRHATSQGIFARRSSGIRGDNSSYYLEPLKGHRPSR